MLEYKILTANSLEQAEQVMNDMARAGSAPVTPLFWNGKPEL